MTLKQASGEVLQARCRKRDITQAMLYHNSGLEKRTVQRYWYGERIPTLENLKGHGITVFGQHKTSLGILVLAKPENYEMARKALENIVSTIQIGKPTENRGVVAELAGTWVYYSGGSSPNIARSGSWSHSYQETVYFDGVGNYRWKSSSHVAASSHQWGNSESSASNIGANNSMGTYTVIDNTLITTNEHGTFTYDFQLYGKKLVSGGRTFLKE